MNRRSTPLLVVVLALGCVVWIREPMAYREEIVELVEVRDEAIAQCYDELLERRQREAEKVERAVQGPYADIDPAVDAKMSDLHGKVGVRLAAARRTGAITATLVPGATTAPPEVAACVVEEIQGLHLQPADERGGQVTLVFQLAPGKRTSGANVTSL